MQYHVDAAQIATAAARTGHTAQTIRTEAAAMMAQLVDLDAAWGGTAASAFGGVREQWRGAQMQVEAALEAISQALSHAAQSYEEAETAASRLFAR